MDWYAASIAFSMLVFSIPYLLLNLKRSNEVDPGRVLLVAFSSVGLPVGIKPMWLAITDSYSSCSNIPVTEMIVGSAAAILLALAGVAQQYSKMK